MNINEDIYRSVKNMLMASGQLETVLNLFVANSRERLQLLKQASASKDNDSVKSIAHAIKGSCSMLGGARCAEICQGIEDAAKRDHGAILDQLIRELETDLELLIQYFKADLSRTKSSCCD